LRWANGEYNSIAKAAIGSPGGGVNHLGGEAKSALVVSGGADTFGEGEIGNETVVGAVVKGIGGEVAGQADSTTDIKLGRRIASADTDVAGR